MKESFERWYVSQREYLKPKDMPDNAPHTRKSYADSLAKPKVKTTKGIHEVRISDNPDYLTVDEAALLAKTDSARVYKWISAGRFPVLRISRNVTRIPKAGFEIFLTNHSINQKGE